MCVCVDVRVCVCVCGCVLDFGQDLINVMHGQLQVVNMRKGINVNV